MPRQQQRYPWWNQANAYIRQLADNLNELERLNVAAGDMSLEERERRIELRRATRAVSRALLKIAADENGVTKLAVIGQCYWTGRNIDQVADSVHYSSPQVKRFKSEFLMDVARGMGWKTG